MAQAINRPKLPALNSPFTLGLVVFVLCAGMFFRLIPWQVAVSVGGFFAIFQGVSLWRNNPMDGGFKLRQLAIRVLMVLTGIALFYIAGINAEPYRVIINEWDPPSIWERFSFTDWFLRNLAGYALWGLIQLCESAWILMSTNQATLETLLEDARQKKSLQMNAGSGIGRVAIATHKAVNLPMLLGLLILGIIMYLIDASVLISYYPPFERNILQPGKLAIFFGVLVGFEFLLWVFRLFKGIDTAMQVTVIQARGGNSNE